MKELESNITTELTEKMREIYGKHFPSSAIRFTRGCFGNDTIFMSCYLAQNEKELINGYKENDMFSISFKIRDNGNDTYLMENLAKSYVIKPQEKWFAYSRTQLQFRKVNGNEQKLADTFEKFVIRLKEQLQADMKADLIHDNFKALLEEKMLFLA